VDSLADLARLEGVASAMAAARDGIDALLRDRGLRRTTPELTTESLFLGAVASAALEGSDSTDADLREGRADEVGAATLRVSTELLGLAPVLSRAPLQALARLHTLASKGAVRDDALGRPRDAESARRLGDLSRLMLAPTDAPALVVAAVVHAEIATAEPFEARNGVVARAAERLVLVARGVDPTSLTVPEEGHRRLGPAYTVALQGYRDRGLAGVHAWLLHAADAYTGGAQASPLQR